MLSTLLLLATLSSSGAVIYLGIRLRQTQREQNQLRQKLREYDSLTSRQEQEKQLDSNIQLKQNELAELEKQQNDLKTDVKSLQEKRRKLEAITYCQLEMEDYYEFKYNFIYIEDYIFQLKNVKKQQKEMRKSKQAYLCYRDLSEGKSTLKARKMNENIMELIRMAFETKCDYNIRNIKFNNLENIEKKIRDNFKKINELASIVGFQINTEYLELKLQELHLDFECEEKKQETKEREQEIKKEERESNKIKKARQEFEKVEEREKLHQQELDQVRQEIEQVAQAEVEKRKQLELQIQQLERQIAEDRSDKEKANRVKWGYIYIISNIGSFREQDVYRICMTNRQREDDYIRDMNPAVPFKFDVHFKIFSEDVYDTLERLHNRFDDKRVNKVNFRRDFFEVSLDEIEQAVTEIKRETEILRIDTFKPVPNASEYWQTLAIRKKNQN